MREIERHLFVIFGASGDLTRRKLLPALYRVMTENGVEDRTVILGVSSTAMSDDEFRGPVPQGAGRRRDDRHRPRPVDGRADLLPPDSRWRAQTDRSARPRRRHRTGLRAPRQSRLLSRHPAREASPGVITALGDAGLDRPPGWSRLVIEKPFGRDPRVGAGAQRPGPPSLRRVPGVPHRPLSGEGERAEPAHLPLHQPDLRDHLDTGTDSIASRSPSPRSSGSSRGAGTTSPPVCCATWCRTISPSSSPWSPWRPRRRSGPTPSARRRCRSSTRCGRSTPPGSCSASTRRGRWTASRCRATATRTRSPPARPRRRSPPCGFTSTAGDGRASPSTCGPGSGYRSGPPRSR